MLLIKCNFRLYCLAFWGDCISWVMPWMHVTSGSNVLVKIRTPNTVYGQRQHDLGWYQCFYTPTVADRKFVKRLALSRPLLRWSATFQLHKESCGSSSVQAYHTLHQKSHKQSFYFLTSNWCSSTFHNEESTQYVPKSYFLSMLLSHMAPPSYKVNSLWSFTARLLFSSLICFLGSLIFLLLTTFLPFILLSIQWDFFHVCCPKTHLTGILFLFISILMSSKGNI